MKAKVEKQGGSNVTLNYGTHMENVVKITETNISVFDENFENDKIVIAKENDESLYVTIKSNIDSKLLDPYKCYRKNIFTVKPAEEEQMFTVKYKETGKFITV